MSESIAIAKTDIPKEAHIECDAQVYAEIISGRAKGEIVKKEGKYVLQLEEGSIIMERYWLVQCFRCETHVHLPISEFTLISIDQGAEFIRRPSYICGKCKSVCTVDIEKEKENEQEQKKT